MEGRLSFNYSGFSFGTFLWGPVLSVLPYMSA